MTRAGAASVFYNILYKANQDEIEAQQEFCFLYKLWFLYFTV